MYKNIFILHFDQFMQSLLLCGIQFQFISISICFIFNFISIKQIQLRI